MFNFKENTVIERCVNVNFILHNFAISLHRLMVRIKQPEMEISSLNHILSPFVSALWIVVISAIVVLAVILSVTWNVLKKFGTNAGSTSYSFYDSLFYVLGSFCQQGLHQNILWKKKKLPRFTLFRFFEFSLLCVFFFFCRNVSYRMAVPFTNLFLAF